MTSVSNDQSQVDPFLKDWWDGLLHHLLSVERAAFVDNFLKWIEEDPARVRAITYYDQIIANACQAQVQAEAQAVSSLLFMNSNNPFVDLFVSLLDKDGDEILKQKDLYNFHVWSLEAANQLGMSKPPNVIGYMGIVAEYFKDRQRLLEHERAILEKKHLKLQDSLKVKGMIQSYDINTKLSEYLCGTRDWIFKELDQWIMTNNGDSEPNPVHIPELMSQLWVGSVQTQNCSRLFLLLAGPGMGKSVFSAVVPSKLKMLQDPKSKTILASDSLIILILL